jgi:YesN/AraC family two-component response regulator
VNTAHNGKEALNMIEHDRPDIVLTDVMMPEMDGNQLCHLLKRDPGTANIPVVMLTARLAEENEIESRECGADDYITKPFNVEILKMHVNNLLKLKGNRNDGKIYPQISQMQITSLDEKLVKDATAFVEENLSNPDLSVVSLSEALSMSRVNLYRKLLSVTGSTPSEFIRLIRLRHAEQLLMKSQLSISEIAYKVGFSNQRYFSKCYKELYGYMPSQYKKK